MTNKPRKLEPTKIWILMDDFEPMLCFLEQPDSTCYIKKSEVDKLIRSIDIALSESSWPLVKKTLYDALENYRGEND